MPYWLLLFFSITRLVLFFIIVFAWLGPKFLSHAKKLHGIDRMLYSWVGVGGLLVALVFVLTTLHMYDLISLFTILILIPVSIKLYREIKKGTSLRSLFSVIENKIVANQVRFIESIKVFTFKGIKERFNRKSKYSFYDNRFTLTAILIGIIACVIRVIPILKEAAPYSRAWYFELEGVKSIRLQQYFSEFPIPKGMHSMVGMFSSLTQVGPELTLSLLGSLTGFLLTIIIFWIIREITKGKRQTAAIFGASIFAIFPTLFLPITLEAETGINSILLALCFALPTAFIFIRNLRAIEKAPWFYVTMGIIATGLTDVFTLLVVLLPFLIYGLLAIPKRRFITNFGKIVLYLVVVFSVALSPYIIHLLITGGEVVQFFEVQLLDTLIFSYFPYLITDLKDLSFIYLILTGVLFLIFMGLNIVQKKDYFADELVFFTMFGTLSFLFSPLNNLNLPLLDMDQLNPFYGIMISVLGGLALYMVFTVMEALINFKHKLVPYIQPIILIVILATGLFFSRGINTNTTLPQTLPNGFFEAYYEIINERLPYTYATVSPPIDDVLSLNRHYFMNYEFFLNNYSEIDSSYQEYLNLPKELRPDSANIPPASIFIFIEKAPYNLIQQGILFEPEERMKILNDWIVNFKSLDNREIEIYKETEDSIVYEIINRRQESYIGDILLNIYPNEEGRAAQLFK